MARPCGCAKGVAVKAANFLEWAESWYGAIRWATAFVGRRLVGLKGVFANAIVEGGNQAFYAGLPAHSDQADDAANATGVARRLFKFRNETAASWAARLQGAWDQYEIGGMPKGVLDAIAEWAAAINPGYAGDPAHLVEESWARFSVYLPFGLVPWSHPYAWDGAASYGDDDALYNLRANAVDVDHLRRLVRKWAPARSKGRIRVELSPLVYYNLSGATYGDGTTYATEADLVEFAI